MEALMSSPVTVIDDINVQVREPHVRVLKPSGLRTIATVATQAVSAVREGLAMMHRYENLRAHGASHKAAAEKACAFKS
jgi:hypothetical protein